MWKNSEGAFYFYPKINKCFNLRSLRSFNVDKETKNEWKANGRSKLIGPESLGGW
jgi:hypothetical protein